MGLPSSSICDDFSDFVIVSDILSVSYYSINTKILRMTPERGIWNEFLFHFKVTHLPLLMFPMSSTAILSF